MSKRAGVEDRMRSVQRVCRELSGDELLVPLTRALADRSSLVVQLAAQGLLEHKPGRCVAELVAAWHRFVERPVKSDPGCRAKLAIVEALVDQRCDDAEFFVDGLKYVQHEPAYGVPGGYEDTAAHVRGTCAYGLLNTGASINETLCALVDLLNDPIAQAREHAARAMAVSGLPGVSPLLRMKVLVGDRDHQVIGACLAGLLADRSRRSLEFVGRFLTGDDIDIAIEAGLALGESRREDAALLLIRSIPGAVSELKESLILSLGLGRTPQAAEFLVDLIREDADFAQVAVRSLAPGRFDAALSDRVAAAVAGTGCGKLSALFQRLFSD